ncbi:MAG: HAD-IIIA family hydrolase [Acidimicrobiales bacterium]
MTTTWQVVVPTVGRPHLGRLLDALAGMGARVLVVDDRRDRREPLLAEVRPGVSVLAAGAHGPRGSELAPLPLSGVLARVGAGGQGGPAAARNVGWRAATAEWVAFLDDDVVPDPDWAERLEADLAAAGPEVAGVQGRLRVPLPDHRRPTDWERNVAGLESARWATADMAYRRSALAEVGGFDERFRRAFREDADLALRVVGAGWRLQVGGRTCAHPVRRAGPWVSVRLQAGNADDAVMAAVHGPDWARRAGAPVGRIRRHVAVTAAGLGGLAALTTGHRRLAAFGALGWAGGTAELAWARIAPGPRNPAEVATMVATSTVLPPVAVAWRLAGELRARTSTFFARFSTIHVEKRAKNAERPHAVLLDRDGTLVEDVPYNGDPGKVMAVAGARRALDRLRAAGIPTAVVSNQSGVARGLLDGDQVEAVNRRVEELLGPLGPWLVCLHGPDDGCDCRKPAPGLVHAAAAAVGVAPERCAVIGDIGVDMAAARAAGARGVLVPTATTRPEEVAAAAEVAADLPAAVDLLLGPPARAARSPKRQLLGPPARAAQPPKRQLRGTR